ncbi:hypothetical protein DFH27DRAFT_654480 [Peziza echinospora]|nr:hypothetical protein DFH27DRAFT_654480 [Peziza echinospora]
MALAAYRNILRAIRVAFKDDQTLLTAARQQTRAAFLTSTQNPFASSTTPTPPAQTSCSPPQPPSGITRRRKNPFAPTPPTEPAAPPTTQQLIDHANQVAKILRENVIQGMKVGEVVEPVRELGKRGVRRSEVLLQQKEQQEGLEKEKEKEAVVPVFKLRIHEEIERGDNDTIKNPDTGVVTKRKKGGEAELGGCCGGGSR